MENDFYQKRNNSYSPWFWVFMCVLAVSVVKCSSDDTARKTREAAELKAWQDTPEYAFRFCITTAAGANGTATPEQIAACNKAAGR